MHKSFFIDHSLCTACDACTGACISWNHLEDGVFWIRAVTMEEGAYPNPIVYNKVVVCRHCANAPCLSHCPEKAIYKRPENGVVTVDKSKCTGCRACLEACPFGVPQFGQDGLAQWCNFCADRMEKGLPTACAAACSMRIIFTGTASELSRIAAERSIKKRIS